MKSGAVVFRLSSPRLALLIPVILYGFLVCLSVTAPGLFCVAVNPGGREFVCGHGYSHVGVRLIRLLGTAAWAAVLLIGGVKVIRGGAARASVFAWLVSAALFLTLVVLWLNMPDEDAP
jgi:hypothetical protein